MSGYSHLPELPRVYRAENGQVWTGGHSSAIERARSRQTMARTTLKPEHFAGLDMIVHHADNAAIPEGYAEALYDSKDKRQHLSPDGVKAMEHEPDYAAYTMAHETGHHVENMTNPYAAHESIGTGEARANNFADAHTRDGRRAYREEPYDQSIATGNRVWQEQNFPDDSAGQYIRTRGNQVFPQNVSPYQFGSVA